MTPKDKTYNWEEDFEDKFPALPSDVKRFINETLSKQQQAYIEMGEKLRKEPNWPLPDSEEARQIASEYIGYNQALDDFLALIRNLPNQQKGS